MTQHISVGLANEIASLIANTFGDGYLDFYDADPNTGNLLGRCKLPIAPFAPADNGVIDLAGQWFGTVTHAGTTTVAWARFVAPSPSTAFMDVTVGEAADTKQITVNTKTLHHGDVVSVTAFEYTVPVA